MREHDLMVTSEPAASGGAYLRVLRRDDPLLHVPVMGRCVYHWRTAPATEHNPRPLVGPGRLQLVSLTIAAADATEADIESAVRRQAASVIGPDLTAFLARIR